MTYRIAFPMLALLGAGECSGRDSTGRTASATRATGTTGTKNKCRRRQANRRQTGLGSATRWGVGVNLPFSGSRPNTTTESER